MGDEFPKRNHIVKSSHTAAVRGVNVIKFTRRAQTES